MKRKIGISYSKTNFIYYWNWFAVPELQDQFELVELSFTNNNVEDIARCDGFVLTGGIDIDPQLYNGLNSYEKRPDSFQPERDQFEKQIFQHAISNKIPVLAICRGLQLVNVLRGGTLVQDLGKAGNYLHCKEVEDKLHEIDIMKDSLLFEITGITHGKVNSAHHQAIEKLGAGLKVNALSKDGVIEGLEWEDPTEKAFLLCIQWHPERMFRQNFGDSPLSYKVRDRFIQEIKSMSDQHAYH